MKNAQTIQQHDSKQHEAESIYEILFSLPVRVYLPVRIELWLQPDKTLLNSLTEPIELYLTFQELQTIETRITQQHFTIEAAFIEYLKQEMTQYERWQNMTDQVHQRYGEKAYITLDVKLLGKIRWNGLSLNISQP